MNREKQHIQPYFSGLFFVLFLCFLYAGCATDKEALRTSEALERAPYKNSGLPVQKRVSDLLKRMTLEEKIGQMIMAETNDLTSPGLITDLALGALLSGGNSAPLENTPRGWADMYDNCQSLALETPLAIPLLYGYDAVHGNSKVYGAVVFPHNIGMGCTGDPDLVREAARITALEVVATGVDWTFAPCIAVPRNERWGRTYEGFAETPDITMEMARAMVTGLQGHSLSDPVTILACAKHFAGDGGTLGGVDQGNTDIDEQTLRSIHLPGYRAAVSAGVGSIMASYSSWQGTKVHGNHYLLTDLLKKELGFKGILISDYQAINQLSGDYYECIVTSINAGLDMIMMYETYTGFIELLHRAVDQKDVKISRINDAVARILSIKFRMGLFERPYTNRELLHDVGSSAHREVARECVRKSMVLLKNKDNILPLKKAMTRIHVAGQNGHDLGRQCGGWTISWQGESGPVTKGTTILEGIREVVMPATEVTYSRNGEGAAGADVVVAVIGERPYAEFEGDAWELKLPARDKRLLRDLSKTGIPLVVVLISGRPLPIDKNLLDQWDGFIAAWLPGSEGAGVADVLFGDYNPTGRLSHTWPEKDSQIPINTGDTEYDPLFPYGFGLCYE